VAPLLRIFWQDNNERSAELWFNLPDGETVAQSIVRANALRSASLALSNARITGAKLVYEHVVDGVGSADPDAHVGRFLVCSLESGANSGSVRIPSPKPNLPYDTTGPWEGIRITRDAFLSSGLIQPLELALGRCELPWGDPFPTTFVVASRDYIV